MATIPVLATRPRATPFAWVRTLSDVRILPLVAILVLQAIASLSLQNTAFEDEALYIYGGNQIFTHLMGNPTPILDYTTYFSGFPYLYPFLAGILDHFAPDRAWGLEAARCLSLAFMLFTTVAAYLVTKRLLGRESGIFAALLFAGQGSVLFLGHLATFDAMCLALLALATLLALKAGEAQGPLAVRSVGLILLLAFTAKYAGLLWVPTILALLVWQTWQSHGRREALLRLEVAVSTMVVGVLVAIMFVSSSVFDALVGTTITRYVAASTPRWSLVVESVTLGGVMITLALIGLALLPRRRSLLLLGVILLASALLAPIYHFYKDEPVSLHKHIGYGLFFAAPLAGYLCVRLTGYGRGLLLTHRWLVGLTLCLLVFLQGLQQATSLFNGWPDSTALAHVLRTQVRPGNYQYLAEEMEVPRYYLEDVVPSSQWNDTYYFEYQTRAGQHLVGIPAYRAAIAAGYFDLVALRYGPTKELDQAIDGGLRHSKKYKLIAKLPFSNLYGTGEYWIWKRITPAS